MKVDIKVPSVGESVTEATIAEWSKKSGSAVKRDDVLLLLETDKASVEVVAEHDGMLTTTAKEGDVVKVGAVVGTIDTAAAGATTGPAQATAPAPTAAPVKPSAPPAAVKPATTNGSHKPAATMDMSPAVRRAVAEFNVDPSTVTGTGRGGRLTKSDVMESLSSGGPSSTMVVPTSRPLAPAVSREGKEDIERVPMTTIRKRIAERLVQAQHTAAILTTFNEVDMSALSELRNKYKEKFKEKYDVNLGYMGFFVKAVIEALKAFPKVNASIEGGDILYHHYYHIGIAVGTERGLLVPVLRHADRMSLAEIELAIKSYALKARDGKISVDDLSGGTFTISNGGVYGSLMSTPILNAPQSGILGMHKIEDRPIAVKGQVVIRPMMYLALSYDHRMVDGGESVSFLVRIKDCLEDPSRILLEI
ncbi:MAG: 2-oxoglutarate dehydrogenase complex dihydrolipoyllysine-residue succinyltransferase [Bdellovibrionales bacterium]